MKDIWYYFVPGMGLGLIFGSLFFLRGDWEYNRIGKWVLKRVWFVQTAIGANRDFHTESFAHHKHSAFAYANAYDDAYDSILTHIRVQWKWELWYGATLKRSWNLCTYPTKKWMSK